MNLERFGSRLRTLGCVVGHHLGTTAGCDGGIELHHAGTAEERNDWAQVPLCHEHHEGASGVHGLHRRAFHARYKLTDVQMLAITRRLYAREYE